MKNHNVKFKILKSFKFLVVFLVFLFCVLCLASEARAASASLFLSPASNNYTVGSSFSVELKVNSGGEKINAVEGALFFNPDELSVVGISKTGSIFSLWPTEPTFSNSAGNVVFGGGTPRNFIGDKGTIIIITFKAKASASAQVGFSAGSILAADGKGTNILASMNGGVYVLKSRIITPPAREVPPEAEYIPPGTPGAAPTAPVISSSSHPEPEKWYSDNNPEFSWKVPSDVTAIKLLIGKNPTALPTVFYASPISEKKLKDLEDGAWYFHVRFRNRSGWGGIIHRKVLIDTEAPERFEIRVDDGEDPTNPSPILHFKTTDSLSGVEYYEIKIGEQDIVPIIAAALKHNPYKLPPQAPGTYTIIVKAFDKAGNSTPATVDIMIEPIDKPVFTDFPQTVQVGDTLTIKGISSYPQGAVTIFVKKQGEEAMANDVKTDDKGSWLYIHPDSLKKGTYQIWAQITDKRGAKSEVTEKITLAAALPFVLKFGKIAIDYLSMIITLIILIIGAIVVIFYSWHRISVWQKRLRQETKEVKESVASAFRALREEVREQIEELDKKPGLTKGEKKIRDKLEEALNISEEFISKEIKDVEKELE